LVRFVGREVLIVDPDINPVLAEQRSQLFTSKVAVEEKNDSVIKLLGRSELPLQSD
jgi:hypothetical protein